MNTLDQNLKILDKIMDDYKLTLLEKEELLTFIGNIFKHEEFQRRMGRGFLHHSDITLGYHILQDTVVTYLLCKKKIKIGIKVDLELALDIAMMHDLYTVPWQNNKESKCKKFKNKHGFRHPIESVINSLTWYFDIFENSSDKYALIDGIIHHMYPFPVETFDDYADNVLELKNFELVSDIEKEYINLLRTSTNRFSIGCYSFARPISIEGRIVAHADKIVSKDNLNNMSSLLALITGKNKKIDDTTKKK